MEDLFDAECRLLAYFRPFVAVNLPYENATDAKKCSVTTVIWRGRRYVYSTLWNNTPPRLSNKLAYRIEISFLKAGPEPSTVLSTNIFKYETTSTIELLAFMHPAGSWSLSMCQGLCTLCTFVFCSLLNKRCSACFDYWCVYQLCPLAFTPLVRQR